MFELVLVRVVFLVFATLLLVWFVTVRCVLLGQERAYYNISKNVSFFIWASLVTELQYIFLRVGKVKFHEKLTLLLFYGDRLWWTLIHRLYVAQLIHTIYSMVRETVIKAINITYYNSIKQRFYVMLRATEFDFKICYDFIWSKSRIFWLDVVLYWEPQVWIF